jgi:hypothetical protein
VAGWLCSAVLAGLFCRLCERVCHVSNLLQACLLSRSRSTLLNIGFYQNHTARAPTEGTHTDVYFSPTNQHNTHSDAAIKLTLKICPSEDKKDEKTKHGFRDLIGFAAAYAGGSAGIHLADFYRLMLLSGLGCARINPLGLMRCKSVILAGNKTNFRTHLPVATIQTVLKVAFSSLANSW